jgi:ABC-2 type transport system permease protein
MMKKIENIYYNRLKDFFNQSLRIWMREYQLILSDVGVLIIILAVPVIYPLLYSLIYYPEVVRDLPVAVTDLSNTSDSRTFIRNLNSTPELNVTCQCTSMNEAIQLFKERKVKGIVQIPKDFAEGLANNRPVVVSAYADMEFFLYYKALMTGVNFVAIDMGKEIQCKNLINEGYSISQAEAIAEPLDIVDNAMSNRAGGFASYGIPAALILIIQQTLVLAIGIMAGTARERHPYGTLVSLDKNRLGIFRQVIGKSAAYFSIYAILCIYMLGLIPNLFGYEHRADLMSLIGLITPFLLSSIFFGMSLSVLFRSRESAMMLYLFSSIPLLFLSGIIWPLSNFDSIWLLLRQVFPSSNAMIGFIKMNSLGAGITETRNEIIALWIQSAVYLAITCTAYGFQVKYAESLTMNKEKRLHIHLR